MRHHYRTIRRCWGWARDFLPWAYSDSLRHHHFIYWSSWSSSYSSGFESPERGSSCSSNSWKRGTSCSSGSDNHEKSTLAPSTVEQLLVDPLAAQNPTPSPAIVPPTPMVYFFWFIELLHLNLRLYFEILIFLKSLCLCLGVGCI